MEINLKDHQPIQKKYTSVPRPYPEVKQYIEDLLNQNFITKSKSPYSSPVVCVRKKDGTLRLCIDYRELNRRTIADRCPIPRVQETLDCLGGNTWFTVLDQGKSYHQGFMSKESMAATAFGTPWGLHEWVRIPFGLNFAKIAKPIDDLLTTTGNTGQLPSKTPPAAEKNYNLHACKLEFLALKWTITYHFRDYLYHSPKFTVFTDNNPLTYILRSAIQVCDG